VIPALSSLLALQQLDTAADDADKRLASLPEAERALDERVAAAAAAVESAKATIADNQQARRALEKDVAGVDARLARFSDHRAAVKTNQEYTALLHEIETAQTEKDALEEKILLRLVEADDLDRELARAEAGAASARNESEAARGELTAERRGLETERAVGGLEPTLLARYEQLRKQRRGVAVAAMTGETCSACFVRLRPHIVQQIRRNDGIVQCESCQRILYWSPPSAPDAEAART
jgi:hypothetical protein